MFKNLFNLLSNRRAEVAYRQGYMEGAMSVMQRAAVLEEELAALVVIIEENNDEISRLQGMVSVHHVPEAGK